jgi:hypothetical protein
MRVLLVLGLGLLVAGCGDATAAIPEASGSSLRHEVFRFECEPHTNETETVIYKEVVLAVGLDPNPVSIKGVLCYEEGCRGLGYGLLSPTGKLTSYCSYSPDPDLNHLRGTIVVTYEAGM